MDTPSEPSLHQDEILPLRLQVRVLPLFGPGKMQLLEAVDRHGSISAAARAVEMAYPNAWRMLDAMNRQFREPLTVRTLGGRRGGGAALTPTGRIVLNIFRGIEAKITTICAGDLEVLSQLVVGPEVRQGGDRSPQAAPGCGDLPAGPGSAACRQRRSEAEPIVETFAGPE